MSFGFAGVAAITVICVLARRAAAAALIPEKWLPVICGVIGGTLGAVGLLAVPGFPASDILGAIAVGVVSGFSAAEK